ncbi:Osmolarity sensor protein EnvZ [compost metagenome]
MLNLVINAAQAVDGAGCIRVSCLSEKDHIVLSVEDDGPGFTCQTHAQALDRRFTTKALGAGLGLASIDVLMKAANGLVTLGRSDLGGANVRMAFPARRPAAGVLGDVGV